MNLQEFDVWAKNLLGIERFAGIDDSLNGIQIACSDKPIKKMAFAVDASIETARRAKEAGADVLFVHHGLFWGKPLAIKGGHRARIMEFLNSDLGLYACHLPLDAHPELGNNAVLAKMLELRDVEPFGYYKGVFIGLKGRLDPAISLEEAGARVLPSGDIPRNILPFGPKMINSAAVISGGGAFNAFEAMEQGIDLYVTGEPSHSIYHQVAEAGMHFMAAGHYATEVHGVKAVAEKLSLDTGIPTLFIELPTAL